MYNAFYLVCFGLIMIASVFLTVTWGLLSFARVQELNWKNITKDRYLVLSSALAVNAFGTGTMFASRIVTVLSEQAPAAIVGGISGWLIALGMAIMLGSKFAFMWAVELNKGGRWWITFVVISVIWAVFAIWWTFHV